MLKVKYSPNIGSYILPLGNVGTRGVLYASKSKGYDNARILRNHFITTQAAYLYRTGTYKGGNPKILLDIMREINRQCGKIKGIRL